MRTTISHQQSSGCVSVNNNIHRKIVPSRLYIMLVWLTRLVVICLFIVLLIVVAFHGYIAWLLGRPSIIPLSSNPLEAISIPYEDVYFSSVNEHIELEGWYLPSGHSQRTVIFSHGYGTNREENWIPMYDLAKAAHLNDFNILMFDYGFVQSDQVATGGFRETSELLAAIELAKDRGAGQIFIWGFSMGAGTAMNAALQSNDITAMILDSTFVLSPDTLYYNIRQHSNLPRFPSLHLLEILLPVMNGVSMSQLPYENIENASYPIPLFLIHGMQDEKAPYQLAENVYNNQQNQGMSRLLLVEEGRHELLYRENKRAYLQETLHFLELVSQAATD